MQINISENQDLPIYQQIVNFIAQEILSGNLPAGTKLPTIRELAKENNVSLGTVKHAYDTLLQMNLTEMTQGRGTFVCESEQVDITSKKQMAMLSLERMIHELRDLSFTNQEIRIYFDLKMREHEQEDSYVKVGIVDCSPEALSEINNQLSVLKNIEISEYVVDDVVAAPEMMRDDLHLFITTANHYGEISRILGREDNLMQMALAVSSDSIINISKIRSSERVGIVAESHNYAKVILNEYQRFSSYRHVPEIYYLGKDDDLGKFLEDKNVIIGFTNMYKFASKEENEKLAAFHKKGRYINFGYEVDKGSLLYIKDRIESIYSAINTD